MIDVKDSDLQELKRIQESIPEDLKKRLIMKRMVTPGMAKAVRMALREKNLDEATREKLQHIKDSGIVDQKEDVVNQSVQKKIDRFISQEIEKSIKAGRLSKRPNHEQK